MPKPKINKDKILSLTQDVINYNEFEGWQSWQHVKKSKFKFNLRQD